MADDPWADDARCPSCGHHAGRDCDCTCCPADFIWPKWKPKGEHVMFDGTLPTAYQRCKTCGLHVRTGRYSDHKHREARRG